MAKNKRKSFNLRRYFIVPNFFNIMDLKQFKGKNRFTFDVLRTLFQVYVCLQLLLYILHLQLKVRVKYFCFYILGIFAAQKGYRYCPYRIYKISWHTKNRIHKQQTNVYTVFVVIGLAKYILYVHLGSNNFTYLYTLL